MKKINIILCYILMMIIPLYFILLWNPKNKDSIVVSDKILNQESVPTIKINNDEVLSVEEDEDEEILRINFNNMMKEMDSNNKKKLNNILYKLPISEYEKIICLFGEGDNKESVKELLTILERRLKASEYEEIKIILSPYINFEVI